MKSGVIKSPTVSFRLTFFRYTPKMQVNLNVE